MENYGNRTRSGPVYSAMTAPGGRGTKSAGKPRNSKRSKKSKKGRKQRRPNSEQPRMSQAPAYVTEESFKTNPDKTSSFQVRVSPRAQKGIIVGWMDDEHLKVRIVAAPEGGRANIELLRLLGIQLKVPVRNLSIVRGSSSTDKLVKVVGLDDEEVRRRLPK